MVKSAVNTPKRSGSEKSYGNKTSTPARNSTKTPAKTPKGKNNTAFKKILGHSVNESHYVDFEVELNNGEKRTVADYEFKTNEAQALMNAYKEKVTKQKDDGKADYIVEKIITHRMVGKKPLFLVEWTGYPNPVWHSELWEKDLGNCREMLEEYKQEANLDALRTPAKTPKHTTTHKRKAPSSSYDDESDDDDEEDEPVQQKLKKNPEVKRMKTHESSSVSIPQSSTSVERVEEIQDDDEEEEGNNGASAGPSTSMTTKSSWFGGWTRWF